MLLIILALAALGIWLGLTWWNQPEAVTFKTVIQNVLRDVADVLKLKAAALWLQTNVVALAVLSSDMISMADPTLRNALLSATWHGVPIGGVAIMFVTWLATVKPTVHTRHFGDPA